VTQIQSEWASARVQEKGFAALARRIEIEQHELELRKFRKNWMSGRIVALAVNKLVWNLLEYCLVILS
jgi:hypothetical protein